MSRAKRDARGIAPYNKHLFPDARGRPAKSDPSTCVRCGDAPGSDPVGLRFTIFDPEPRKALAPDVEVVLCSGCMKSFVAHIGLPGWDDGNKKTDVQ